jgi:glycosyltransferase involved in cell wall biosynthesis
MADANAYTERERLAIDSTATQPLRVAGVDPEREFAGGQSQVLGLTRELLRMGHRAELICDPAGKLFERAAAEGVRCHRLRLRNSVDLAGGMRLRSIVAREGYDVVHFHTARAHAMAPFVRGLARILIATRRMDYRPNRLLAPFLYSRAVDGVAAISDAVATALISAGVPRERITVIPSGVDCEYFRPPSSEERIAARQALGLAAETIAVGSIGALEERKGHRHLLEAITPAMGGVVCFIAGDGSLRADLERRAEALGISTRTRFLGRIETSRDLLWALDIFVFPSLWEGLGVAALEAAASGVATIASNAGGIAEVVRDGETGVLVAPADSRALGDAIARLVASAGERASLGEAARKRAVAQFAMSAMAQRTMALYRACLGARKDRT